MDQKTVQEVVKIVRGAGTMQTVPGGNIPFVLVPDGHTVKGLGELIYNDHSERPERIKQAVTVYDADSFCEYCKKFADEDTRIFADELSQSVLAVIDYHESSTDITHGKPRWGQHSVRLQLRKSPQWLAWLGSNNRKPAFTQTEFAEFLEQYAMDVVNPGPAAIMDVARDLEAKTEVEFAQSQRMNDGQVRLKYSETTSAKVGNGTVDVPEKFTIRVPPFLGEAMWTVEALLRFRVNAGKLTFWYTLVRPEEAEREAFGICRSEIASKLGVTILNGTPAKG